MIVRLDGNAQADNFNQQKANAHMSLEYSYLQYHLAPSRTVNTMLQPKVQDFGAIDDMTLFSARIVWPPWLSVMVQSFQQPITEAQKKLMTSMT